ncbi:Agamous-like MADS-box protein AGL12 [Raphanus sativus]|uniref:Agamous-like MADS-box protein AGL12 n=1 Tax=Raphanus sativus TaxID=3726 RepID=A0A6J0L4X3_RAPSA|nr:agamous-like MADS-box protein AGL12 [Raphanus sativus]KAJ4874867.1 Agamous-like MADS-box protein AGL12 [Raphanus sativus]
MVRGKIQLKRIENPVHRQVTFCKRRTGLLKKAKELSVLCDAEIGVVIFSPQGKLFELATKGTMEGVIDKYMKCTSGGCSSSSATYTAQEQLKPQNHDPKDEVNVLKQEIEMLQKGIRYRFGGGEGAMNLEELLLLEKHLEYWISQIRSAKMEIMFQEIQSLRNKEGVLKNANKYLLDKIEENNNSILYANLATVETNYSYPLAMPNEIFQF